MTDSTDSTEDAPDALVGTVVAERYRVETLLGAGGMGAVYRAEHVHMRKTVALKVLHRELTSLQEVVARFEREAIAAARIEHPNVAAATDFGKLEDGSFYLVLEYIDGTSLGSRLRDGPLKTTAALRIARQIAEALQAAHQSDIVHRDLKPDNVMLVTQPDGTELVKVLDFGIAKVEAEEAAPDSKKLTRIGTVMGTAAYMAPEQAVGQAVDARADLYALGVILYEMVSGRVPFAADSITQVLAKQLTEAPPALPRGTPRDVAALVEQLLQKTPADRPSTARAVSERIDTLLRDIEQRNVGGSDEGDTGTYAIAFAATIGSSIASIRDKIRHDRRRVGIIAAAALTLGAISVVAFSGGEASDATSVVPSAAARTEGVPGLIASERLAPSKLRARANDTATTPHSAPQATASGGSASASPSASAIPSASATPSAPASTSASAPTTAVKTKRTTSSSKAKQGQKKKERNTVGGIYIPPPKDWF